MSGDVNCADFTAWTNYFVPGTCVATHQLGGPRAVAAGGSVGRNPALKNLYLTRALCDIPRLLGAIDRNPYRPTYGCLDRQYWHYRTSSFPSEMYQEGLLPLALVHAEKLPGNRWYGNTRVRDLAVAAMRFAARASHSDGSCDDYYPFERALGAAVFSLASATKAYQVLKLEDPELVRWFEQRARWLIKNDESGHLANHQALAALGLLRVWQITGNEHYRKAAESRIDKVLGWQSEEGWFEEYGGADPGYQTITIDSLAKYRRECHWGDASATDEARLDEPLRRAVAFARLFLHPDNSYGGEYGSRGTYHFYPHGMELLAPRNLEAAELADGFLQSLASRSEAQFSDDRMFAHRLGNLIEAYLDWSPTRPATPAAPQTELTRYLPDAGMLVRRTRCGQTVISAARGGVFKHFAPAHSPVTDAGLIVETTDGRVAVSQRHDRTRQAGFAGGDDSPKEREGGIAFSVSGPLHWTRFETATPLKQAMFQAGMWSVGRWCRTLVRRLLQRRLITGGRESPIRLTRLFEFLPDSKGEGGSKLRVTDTIELTNPDIRVRRMAFGTDHQAAYVAASGVYQDAVLSPWTDLARCVDELNTHRRVRVAREF